MFATSKFVWLLSYCMLARFVAGGRLQQRSIPQDLLDEFVRFTSFSVGAYQSSCPSPLGTTLVTAINNQTTDTQGYITRDDANKQIIVAFRGSQQLEDFIRDQLWVLVPYESQGVSDTNNASAHVGFLKAYNSVASTVISTVSAQLETYPKYTLVVTGHSLGASLASLAGVSLASNFPDSSLRVFTFGQPRTGDAAYADLAENLIGVGNIYRAVHTYDGVPTLIPQALGFRHHETEFWNFEDGVSTENVKQCSGGEDPTCSDSIPTTGINLAHIRYFGQLIGLGSNSSVCE